MASKPYKLSADEIPIAEVVIGMLREILGEDMKPLGSVIFERLTWKSIPEFQQRARMEERGMYQSVVDHLEAENKALKEEIARWKVACTVANDAPRNPYEPYGMK